MGDTLKNMRVSALVLFYDDNIQFVYECKLTLGQITQIICLSPNVLILC